MMTNALRTSLRHASIFALTLAIAVALVTWLFAGAVGVKPEHQAALILTISLLTFVGLLGGIVGGVLAEDEGQKPGEIVGIAVIVTVCFLFVLGFIGACIYGGEAHHAVTPGEYWVSTFVFSLAIPAGAVGTYLIPSSNR